MARPPTVAPPPRQCPKHPGPPRALATQSPAVPQGPAPKGSTFPSALPKAPTVSTRSPMGGGRGRAAADPRSGVFVHVLPVPAVLKTWGCQRSLGHPESQSSHPGQGNRREPHNKPSEENKQARLAEGDRGGEATAVGGGHPREIRREKTGATGQCKEEHSGGRARAKAVSRERAGNIRATGSRSAQRAGLPRRDRRQGQSWAFMNPEDRAGLGETEKGRHGRGQGFWNK